MSRLLIALILLGLNGTASATDQDPENSSLIAVDNRIRIVVTARERNQVLHEMRTFLHGLHNIHHALARQDLKAVAIQAKPLGRVLNRMPEEMRNRLPEAFLEMSRGQYEVFEVMARDAETKGDMKLTLDQLAEAMTYCSGCHDTYQFQVGRVAGKSGK